jgi:hypothetical protein
MFVALAEHPPNPNMPIRFLLYIAELYALMIDNKEFHQKRRRKPLRPVFIVLYNGLIPMPVRWALKLSDAFEEHTGNCGVCWRWKRR